MVQCGENLFLKQVIFSFKMCTIELQMIWHQIEWWWWRALWNCLSGAFYEIPQRHCCAIKDGRKFYKKETFQHCLSLDIVVNSHSIILHFLILRVYTSSKKFMTTKHVLFCPETAGEFYFYWSGPQHFNSLRNAESLATSQMFRLFTPFSVKWN